nr:unnamed protein product [Callosobruchus chinensis]
MGSIWQDHIPLELISEIFKHLPRRDLYCCYQVCQKWKRAVDNAELWTKVVIYVDRDFVEKTTSSMTSHFSRHIRSLEFGWQTPLVHNRWLPLRVHDLTKKVVHYIFCLTKNNVQISSFKLFDWYELYPFRKIIYHLSRFLKHQTKLRTLIFHNLVLPKSECVKIFDSSIGFDNALTYFEVHNYLYNFNTVFASEIFLKYLRRMQCLKKLKLDYFIVSRNDVIDIIVESEVQQKTLELLEIIIDDTDIHSVLIPSVKWRKFKELCSYVHLSFVIRNICHYEQLEFIFLMGEIPLKSFSLICGCKHNQTRSRNLRLTLSKMIEKYHKTLEYVSLDIRNNKENLESTLLRIIYECRKLKRLVFDGIVNENMELFYEICVYRETARGKWTIIKPSIFYV